MPATIKDVALAAGVSVATVSRAVNGASNVLPETRQRILDAVRTLRFTPSGAARSLITRRTDTIGAILPDLHGEYFSELIRGLDQAARARGLHLLVSSSHGGSDETAAALRAMNGRVDGLIVMSPHADAAFLAHNLPANLPAVLVNTGVDLPGHIQFVVDNFGGATEMTRHLLASGRSRIAFIRGPAGNHESLERLRGYRAGLQQGHQEIIFDGDFTQEAGWATGQRIATLAVQPDAIFASNDMMAIGCMAALSAAGVRVPEDIAVVGFDDIPMARYLTPALTSVRVPIAALGANALNALVDIVELQAIEIADPNKPQPMIVMPVELVVRQSCGAKPPPPQTSMQRVNSTRRKY